MVEVINVEVCGLDRALRRANYSRSTGRPDLSELGKPSDWRRGRALGKRPAGTGHDKFLRGIIVLGDIKLTETQLIHVDTYHWFEITSAQSKMYNLVNMDYSGAFSEYTDPAQIARLRELREQFIADPSPDNFEILQASCPLGLERWMAFATNYASLKTMVNQRHAHKLEGWRYFCRWAMHLPYFPGLTGCSI